MPTVTYEDESGVVQHECDQTHHHEDSRPFVICLTRGVDTTEQIKIHEDRVISISSTL
jgi:hypothetical protein